MGVKCSENKSFHFVQIGDGRYVEYQREIDRLLINTCNFTFQVGNWDCGLESPP